MQLDLQKELTPVFYGSKPVKLLRMNKLQDVQLFSMHWHDRMELLLVQSGHMTVHFGHEQVEAAAGELVIIPPQQLHGGESEDESLRYDTLMFELPIFENAVPAVAGLLRAMEQQKTAFIRKTDRQEIVTAARQLIEELEYADEGAPLLQSAAVYTLCGWLYRCCVIRRDPPRLADTRFAEIIRFIDEHFSEEMTCTALSRRFGYDSAYFSRTFKKMTGRSPTVYIRLLRLEKSKELLRGGYRISDTAAACGFAEVGYFSRCFKQYFGVTPSAYIQNNSSVAAYGRCGQG